MGGGERMNGLIGITGVLAILMILGASIGLLDRKNFSFAWLLAAALLVALNDALLTRSYGMLSDLIGGDWNWQGKLLALGATLVVAALPAFGWVRCGIRVAQQPGSLKAAIPVVALYCAFFLLLALVFPGEKSTTEEVAFQLTMPGFEEEPFYRGVLLLALDNAFRGRKRFAGVDWGWGAFLSCVLFGLAHAFSFSNGSFSFDAITMILTGMPALLAIWLRLRTGSLLLPVLLHNFGNSLSLLG